MTGTEPNKITSSSIRWALLGLSLTMLMPSLDTSIANSGLPVLVKAFDASFQQAQWIILSYLLAITTLIVSVGRLGDIVGRRRLLLIGLAIFNIASLMCGIAESLPFLIFSRAAQGIGAAIMMSLTVAMVGETVPKERTGSAMGLLGTMSAIGTTLGPSLGGLLMSSFGWRMIFLVNLPLGIVNFALAFMYLPADRRNENLQARPAFDWAGTLVLGLTLAAYSLSMTLGHGSLGFLNTALLMAAAVGTALFVLVESKASSPLIDLSMFRDMELSGSLAMSLLVTTVLMATLVVGPFYLSRGLGLDTAFVGVALSVGPLVAALSGVPAGRIVDRFGSRRMILSGLMGIASGTLLLSLLPTGVGLVGYLLPIAIVTSSYALFQAANNTAIMNGVSQERRGVTSALVSLSRNLGLITGASMMGAVFSAASAGTEITTADPALISYGMRVTFGVAAAFMIVALGIAVMGRIRSRNTIFQEA